MVFYSLSLLQLLLLFMTFFIVFVGSLINWFEAYLPSFFPENFRYGKFAYNGKPSKLKLLEVPKSWFKHFYVFASLFSLYALYTVIDVYLYNAEPSQILINYLDILCNDSRTTNCKFGGSTSVLIALCLMTLQSFRRLYETYFVSIFSKGKINISIYLIGYIHYWVTITIILAEASGFKTKGKVVVYGASIYDSNLKFHQICGIILFVYASINQHKSARILSNLRRNSKGDVVTLNHKIPRGGLFEYVSSPHLSCEVLIYLSLWMILYNNVTFKYVFMWVFCNQLEVSLLNHWWYQKTFKSYPESRKAFIPFIL